MGTSEIALERVQALLKVDTGDGSLYTHLVRTARMLATEKPHEALAQLETLSRNLKKASFRGASAPDPEEDAVTDAAAEEKRRRWCAESLQLVRPPSDPTAAPKVLAAVQNFMEDASMFAWAGVGFGKQESFHIAMSLRKLAAETAALERLRLWGKILGTDGDYYVAEGALHTPPVDRGTAPKPVLPGSPEYDVEPRGEGANTFSYWVSPGGTAPWIRLPAARASHIVAARKIKQLLKGDLGSPVHSMPWFPGKERHLLRAQIARITASCSLAVAGFYELDDGEEAKKNAIRPVEGALENFPGHEALADLGGWVHCSPALLSTGKSTWPDLAGLEDGDLPEETVAALNAQKENEPEKEMLESIAADLDRLKPDDSEGSPAWNIKVYGDKGQYTFPDGNAKSYRITALRSLVWPGAVSVAQGTKFANLYVGYGLKCAGLVDPDKETGLPLTGAVPFSSGNDMLPMAPEAVMEEPQDLEEQEEPQPKLQDDASDGDDMDPPDDAA